LYSQIGFFIVGFVITIGVLGIFGLNGLENCLIKYVAIPAGFTIFMTKIKFDGKRPDLFLKSMVRFLLSSHLLCRYEVVGKPKQYGYEGAVMRIIKKRGREKKNEKGVREWGTRFQ